MSNVPGPPSDTATVDFEVYSEAGFYMERWNWWRGVVKGKPGLKGVGTYNYARHPSTRILCLAYNLHNGDGTQLWFPELPDPEDLFEHVRNGGLVEAHNSLFEYWIWKHVCEARMGWPPLPLEQMTCTMSRCGASGLPFGLANVHHAIEMPVHKQDIGKDLIKEFCVPNNKKTFKYKLTQLYEYCISDVDTEDALSRRIPELSASERDIWLMDQRINDRGVQIDVAATIALASRIEKYVDQAGRDLAALTAGAVTSPRQVDRMGKWLENRGLKVSRTKKGRYNLDKAAVENLFGQTLDNSLVWDVLTLRQQFSLASVDKIKTMAHMVDSKGRLRGLFRYFGAHTGRWTSMGVQLQNLARGTLRPDDVRRILEEIKCDNWSSVEGPHPLATIASLIRGLFIAAPGHELIGADYSAIEGVGAAMLSGEQWRIDVFRGDGKIYERTAADISGVPLEEILGHPEIHGVPHPLRKLGKVAELACFSRETEVITDKGLKCIVDIKNDDLLWDGVEWVEHGGVVCKGKRKTISLDGLRVTPDHPVSMNGSWKEAKQLASNKNMLTRALENGMESLPSLETLGKMGIDLSSVAAHAEIYQTSHSAISSISSPHDAEHVEFQSAKIKNISNTSKNTKMRCRTMSIDGDSVTDSAQPLTDAEQRMTQVLLTMEGGESEFIPNGLKTSRSSSNTSKQSKGGTSLNLKLTELTMMETTNREISDSCHASQTRITKGNSENSDCESTSCRTVYDITNVGPRHRFMVKTTSGFLVVHNSAYQGWDDAWLQFGAGRYLPDKEKRKRAILRWRAASPVIVDMWGGQVRKHPDRWEWTPELWGIEGAIVKAIQHPNETFMVRELVFKYSTLNDVLLMRLPSGRCLWYRQPRLTQKFHKWSERMIWRITYKAWSDKVGWRDKDTFGGRVFENATQGVCRDPHALNMLALEAAGYPIVIHVHDEPVMEVPRGSGSVDEVRAIMQKTRGWFADWPIRVGQPWRADMFGKY